MKTQLKYVDMVNKDIGGSLVRTDHIHDSKGHGTIIMFTEKKKGKGNFSTVFL